MKLRPFLVRVHRWLSLCAMAFWLVQALTGIISVFHWEIDDATIPGAHRTTDLASIDRRIALLTLAGSGRTVTSIWTSAGAIDRWDVTVADAKSGAGEQVRIDGDGDVLRIRRDDENLTNGGWLNMLVTLHQTLLAGDIGSWIVGLSGILLLSNLALGLTAAWPRRRTWRRALRPSRVGPLPARFYTWHRAIGLWAVIPAMVLVSCGVLRVFSDGFERLIGADLPAVASHPPHGAGIPFSRAVSVALARHPGATLAGADFPNAGDANWKIRVREPGEPVRAYGATTVFVDGDNGRVLADFDAGQAPFGRRIAALIYPLHTGEIGGLAGRFAVLALGLWLFAMIGMGAALWWTRSRLRRGRAGQ